MSNRIIPDRTGVVDDGPTAEGISTPSRAKPARDGDPGCTALVIARDLKPLHDRVLVQRFPTESTLGSIVIPQTAREKALRGIVVAAGPGKKDRDGVFHETMVKPGDEVLFTASVDVPYADLVHEGDLVMMAEADILGILPKLKGEEGYR